MSIRHPGLEPGPAFCSATIAETSMSRAPLLFRRRVRKVSRLGWRASDSRRIHQQVERSRGRRREGELRTVHLRSGPRPRPARARARGKRQAGPVPVRGADPECLLPQCPEQRQRRSLQARLLHHGSEAELHAAEGRSASGADRRGLECHPADTGRRPLRQVHDDRARAG
jgi:hypothetical protein